MSLSVGQIFLGVLVLAASTYTVLGYPHKYGALSGRSRLFRTLGVFLLDLLLGLTLLYTFIDFAYGADKRVAAARAAAYILACLFLAFALLTTALLDSLESVVAYRRERRRALEEIIRGENQHRKAASEEQAECERRDSR